MHKTGPHQISRGVPSRLIETCAGVVQGVLACDHGPLATRLWALEYAVLFRGVPPFPSRFGFPFLLGGATQYLRRDVLEAVGAFDCWHVT